MRECKRQTRDRESKSLESRMDTSSIEHRARREVSATARSASCLAHTASRLRLPEARPSVYSRAPHAGRFPHEQCELANTVFYTCIYMYKRPCLQPENRARAPGRRDACRSRSGSSRGQEDKKRAEVVHARGRDRSAPDCCQLAGSDRMRLVCTLSATCNVHFRKGCIRAHNLQVCTLSATRVPKCTLQVSIAGCR